MSNSLGDDAFCKNLTTTTITDINGSTGLVGEVLVSTALGIDWSAGGAGLPQDLQSVCNIGFTTNTNIIMTNGGIQQDPTVLISTSTAGNPIKIGHGTPSLTVETISIGTNTGNIGQGQGSIAIGENAGLAQGLACVALGDLAGQSQLDGAISIGFNAGQSLQGLGSVAIGSGAGQQVQSGNSVAIGLDAGNDQQGQESVAIGHSAGFKLIAQGSIAIGSFALSNANGAGKDTIAIGTNAMDQPVLFNGNIILNSSGSSFPDFATFPPTSGGRFYVSLIKADDGSHTNNQPLHYDTDTGEIYYL